MTDADDDDPAPTTVTGASERIWLIVGDLDQGPPGPVAFKDLGEVTWCVDPQWDGDIEYVRVDLKKGEARPNTKGGSES